MKTKKKYSLWQTVINSINSVFVGDQDDLKFLKLVFKKIARKSTEREIYNLFATNIDKLNDQLVHALKIWLSYNKSPSSHRMQTIVYLLNRFGMLIYQFPLGCKKDNLELAISFYTEALKITSKNEFPRNWLTLNINLGACYRERIAGKKAKNVEISIEHLTNIIEAFDPERLSKDKALLESNFGDVNISLMEHIAMAKVNLAGAYFDRVAGERRNNIERSIEMSKSALNVLTEIKFPRQWASIHNNLGLAYSFRIEGDKRENIELAIKSLKCSLKVRAKENLPLEWANLQNSLGIAYKARIAGNKRENIELAIEAYEAALQIYNKAELPSKRAISQGNLAAAYTARIKGDSIENIEIAIALCASALQVCTKSNFPIHYARTKDQSGRAYTKRTSGNRAENLELSIKAFNHALEIYTQNDFPELWAMVKNNLADVYRNRIYGDEAENLELAISANLSALEVYTKEDFPLDWVMVCHDLGLAYSDRLQGNRAENLELAIAALDQVLEVWTKQNNPYAWAKTQQKLGSIYKERIVGDKTNNLQLSIRCYKAALTIQTIQSDTIEYIRSSRVLSSMYFVEGDWQSTIEYGINVIEAIEQIRSESFKDRNREKISSLVIDVYQNVVQACINLGQMDKAIEYVERGKARNLVDLLATRDLYPKGNIPQEVIDRLDSLKQEAIAEERRLGQQRNSRNGFDSLATGDNRGLAGAVGDHEALNRDRLNQIRQELDNLVKEHIQEKDPSFQLTQKVEPISFEKIKEALPTEQTVLIEWFIGNGTLSAFIVTRQQEIPVYFDYTKEQFQAVVDRASQYYNSYRQRDGQWHSALPDLLKQLAQGLQIEAIIEQIKGVVPDCDRLILVPHRWLHLLPIHALPLADNKCLLDLFPQGVSYAPSVQLLELTQKQTREDKGNDNFFAVQNPTGDLEFTNVEVRAIRSGFQPNDDVLRQQEATKSALTKERLGQANVAHFSCHGTFNFEHPELSALLMAGSQVEGEADEAEGEEKGDRGEKIRFLPSRDGGNIDLEQCLTLGEIFGLDLRKCRLVTLSACETGLTDFRSLSDEYIGLPSGFLYAGSPSVVSSLWAVNDLSTSFLMIKFYQNLQEIDSVPVALNQAQIWLRSVTKEELYAWGESLPLPLYEKMPYLDSALQEHPPNTVPYASPYYWAAFCAVGQ